MQKQLTIKLLPAEAGNDTIIRSYIASSCAVPISIRSDHKGVVSGQNDPVR